MRWPLTLLRGVCVCVFVCLCDFSWHFVAKGHSTLEFCVCWFCLKNQSKPLWWKSFLFFFYKFYNGSGCSDQSGASWLFWMVWRRKMTSDVASFEAGWRAAGHSAASCYESHHCQLLSFKVNAAVVLDRFSQITGNDNNHKLYIKVDVDFCSVRSLPLLMFVFLARSCLYNSRVVEFVRDDLNHASGS